MDYVDWDDLPEHLQDDARAMLDKLDQVLNEYLEKDDEYEEIPPSKA